VSGPRLFLILSVHRTDEGQTLPPLCVWWRANASGYTTNLAEAGRYTQAEIERHADPPHHVAIPLELVTTPRGSR
jgi:hypothetical protein